MGSSEESRVQNMMRDINQGNQTGQELGWDARNRTIREVGPSDPDGNTLKITPEDMKHWTDRD